MSHIFFDTFFNIEKYLDHEQKDPFSVIRVRLSDDVRRKQLVLLSEVEGITFLVVFSQEMETESQEFSDWEKYAAEEYDILVAEEAANDQCNDA